jgi:hypothetical protein
MSPREEDGVTQRGRFVVVMAIGVLCSGLMVAVLWMLGLRGPLNVALCIGLTTPFMHLLDSRLADRAALPVVTAAAHGLLGGGTAWAMLTWLHS